MPDSHAIASSGASQAVAVVLATTEASGLRCSGGTLLDRLTGQLATLPVRDVHVVARSSDIIHASGGTHMIGTEGSRGLADDLRRIAKVARSSVGPVLVVAGDLVAHTEALAMLVEHPARDTVALVSEGGDDPGPTRPPVRTDSRSVVAAGTSFHEAGETNGTFRGVLQVGVSDLAGFAETAERLAELAEAGGFGPMDGGEVPGLLLVGLVRSGAQVRAARLGRLHADRMTEQEDADVAVPRLAEVDENEARLDAAVKSNDGFFATYAVSSWSRHLVKPVARLGLTPNAVTGISVGLAALAAIWFSVGTRSGLIAGAVLLYLSFVLDCVDGQLARYTRAFSPLGAWLDATFDRVKEYAVYLGLAIGYAAGLDVAGGGPDGIWALAVSAMILQMLRHMIDFSYAGARADASRVGAAWARAAGSLTDPAGDAGRPVPPRRPERRAAFAGADAGWTPVASEGEGGIGIGGGGTDDRAAVPVIGAEGEREGAGGEWVDPGDGRTAGAGRADPLGRAAAADGAGPGAGNLVLRLSRAMEKASPTRWFKKIIVLPIGERMALIAVTAAFFNARVTFVALLVWGGIAALYILSGRTGRSLSR
ncbi:CDP-alcohol phosphatidyltransferase family protein [Streptosporangium sp. NBC_01495]|uniref:CDP-alcohol phosphatidyltransferase family protein n=1 Tax=Streptosporangium sp. NBC_01495 TaxID=2903899 RepID=UPI002E355B84|nr:CDP-alcohol phosphatidyltransferase family protein [Streptosporangium sp. NBC_01495]